MSLPSASHPWLALVLDHEVVLRRFDPEERRHSLQIDEGGVPRIELQGGALIYSPDGCSMTREEILLHLCGENLAAATRPPKYVGLAESSKEEIDTFVWRPVDQEAVRPFVVRPDPYPDGLEETAEGAAHALTVKTVALSNSQTKRALSALAAARFRVRQPELPQTTPADTGPVSTLQAE